MDELKKEKTRMNLTKRMDVKNKKVGKADMIRSEKPEQKKEQKKETRDEQSELEMKYLGFSMKEWEQNIAANGGSLPPF